MRTIPIRFDGTKQIDVTEQGEDGTVVLVCSLPGDLAGVKQGEFNFLIGNDNTVKTYRFPCADNENIYFDSKNRLCIRLWAGLTARRFLRFSVTGHFEDGKIAITPYSELLRFAETIRAEPEDNRNYERKEQKHA